MNPTQVTAYQCSNCDKAYLNQQHAEDCCIKPGCLLPGCDKPRDGRSSYCCWDHQSKHSDLNYQAWVMRAEPSDHDYDLPFSEDGETWFSDTDEYWEHLLEIQWSVPFTPEVVPEWVFGTKWVQLHIDLVDLVMEHCSNFIEVLEDLEGLGLPLGAEVIKTLQSLSASLNATWEKERDGYYQRDTKHRIPLRQMMQEYFDNHHQEEDPDELEWYRDEDGNEYQR